MNRSISPEEQLKIHINMNYKFAWLYWEYVLNLYLVSKPERVEVKYLSTNLV